MNIFFVLSSLKTLAYLIFSRFLIHICHSFPHQDKHCFQGLDFIKKHFNRDISQITQDKKSLFNSDQYYCGNIHRSFFSFFSIFFTRNKNGYFLADSLFMLKKINIAYWNWLSLFFPYNLVFLNIHFESLVFFFLVWRSIQNGCFNGEKCYII